MTNGVYETESRNPGCADYWTCPACLHDLGRVGEGVHFCPECHRPIRCTVETAPVAVARLIIFPWSKA